ncbi:malic enzyme-like NAD(P)-binding protein [Ornithinimicrobium sp. W1665]|uniref:malic enzyme-like NAD(P)-binding protein n=1 Tax=Ornithinimicrobium sp. W1665 TaxID=3416666 RepID=UPI003D6A740B
MGREGPGEHRADGRDPQRAAHDPHRHLDQGRGLHPGGRGGDVPEQPAADHLSAVQNPTSRAEATPADVLRWSDGRALVATGSPFEPVTHDGIRHTIAQSNNALIFPGLGLGVAACGATRITPGMIAAASQALASLVNAWRPGAPLLPGIGELRLVSATVAIEVAKQAAVEGVADRPLTDPVQQVYERMWQPRYPEVEAI